MKLKEIAQIIEEVAPLGYASSWDNVGLMVGDLDCDVKKVMLTLDVTPDVVCQAVKENCSLIISHHPFIFESIKAIDFSSAQGKMFKELIQNNINVYSCHTNMDSAEGGINSHLAKMFELEDVVVLEENEKFDGVGIGRVGKLKNTVTLEWLANHTKKLLNTPFVKVVGELSKSIQCIAVASGSCGDLISLAKEKGADAIITADVKYHQALEAKENGICVIDAGRFPTETFVVEILKDILNNTNLEIVCAKADDCFYVI